MTMVWPLQMHHVHKIVLLSLADNASDEGECYPSLDTMKKKCSLSERAIQAAYVDLEKWGCLRRQFRSGRSTVYIVTPAQYAPPQDMHPAQDAPTPAQYAPPPPHNMRGTPAQYAPITINQPSVESSLTPERAPATDAGDQFEAIKQAYPKFSGRKDWITAQHNAALRVEQDGVTWLQLRAAVDRYAKYVRAKGDEGTQYVMLPATFFGAADKPWSQEWELPPEKPASQSGAAIKPAVTAQQIEAEALQQLMNRRGELGKAHGFSMADFRGPHPGETADRYRRAQDTEWNRRLENRKPQKLSA